MSFFLVGRLLLYHVNHVKRGHRMVRYTTRMGFRKNCNGGFLRSDHHGIPGIWGCSMLFPIQLFQMYNRGRASSCEGQVPTLTANSMVSSFWAVKARLVYDFMVLIKCYDYIVMDGNGDYLQNKKHDWRGAPPCIFMQPASSVYCKRKEVPCH